MIKFNETRDQRQRREQAQAAVRERDAVDVPTAAAALGLADRVVREAIAEGRMPSFRLARSIRVPASHLRDLLGIEARS